MTELKTLKDIPIEAGVYAEDKLDNIEPDLKVCFRWKSLIKQEAIEWIKADIKVAQAQESGVNTKMLSACMKWAYRFNIKIEDLK